MITTEHLNLYINEKLLEIFDKYLKDNKLKRSKIISKLVEDYIKTSKE